MTILPRGLLATLTRFELSINFNTFRITHGVRADDAYADTTRGHCQIPCRTCGQLQLPTSS
jgi:hypothetical protein